MAFAASTNKVIVESASDSEDSSYDEVPKKMTPQEAYDKLCTEFIKSEKTSHHCRKELNKAITEKANLLVKLDEITRLVETLVVENTSLKENVKNLEVELSRVKTQIKRMSNAKLDDVLSAQKPNSDKTSLGYAVSSKPSSSTTSGSKTFFVPQSEKCDKCMKSITDLYNSKSFVKHYSRKSSSPKTAHVYHHCGVSRHIRPNCFKLYPQKQVSKWS